MPAARIGVAPTGTRRPTNVLPEIAARGKDAAAGQDASGGWFSDSQYVPTCRTDSAKRSKLTGFTM